MLNQVIDSVEFLQPYKVDGELFSLPSDGQVLIRKYFLEFKEWQGAPIPNTYDGKAIIDWNGEPVFAELAVLRLFQSHGWDGVWVDSYRRKYRTGLPDVAEPVELPEKQRGLLTPFVPRQVDLVAVGMCWSGRETRHFFSN